MIVAVAIGILAASAAEPSRSQHPLSLGAACRHPMLARLDHRCSNAPPIIPRTPIRFNSPQVLEVLVPWGSPTLAFRTSGWAQIATKVPHGGAKL
jgi:hypothetical protein